MTKGGSARRAGSQALALLAVPLNFSIVEALAERPKTVEDLLLRTGEQPSGAAALRLRLRMRMRLLALARANVINGRGWDGFSRGRRFGLTSSGYDLLAVAAAARGWLAAGPAGGLELSSRTGAAVLAALVEGWSTGVVRLLAAGPLTAVDLERLLAGSGSVLPPGLLRAMHLAGLIERTDSDPGVEAEYRVTPWLRRAIGPLAAAVRWEAMHGVPDTHPASRFDVEAAFLLSVPLVRLPHRLSGSCRLAVEFSPRGSRRYAGVLVEVERGRVVACSTRLRGTAESWASGTTASWLYAAIDGEIGSLELGGDGVLAAALASGLRPALFGDSDGKRSV